MRRATSCGAASTPLTLEERAAIVRGEDIFVTLISAGAINPLFVTVGPVDWR